MAKRPTEDRLTPAVVYETSPGVPARPADAVTASAKIPKRGIALPGSGTRLAVLRRDLAGTVRVEDEDALVD